MSDHGAYGMLSVVVASRTIRVALRTTHLEIGASNFAQWSMNLWHPGSPRTWLFRGPLQVRGLVYGWDVGGSVLEWSVGEWTDGERSVGVGALPEDRRAAV